MSVNIITSFQTLLFLARELAIANKSGDAIEIAKAKAAHDSYAELCLKSNRILLGINKARLE